MKNHRLDHVGVIVNDLSAAKEFFLDWGLEVLGEVEGEGEWVKYDTRSRMPGIRRLEMFFYIHLCT